MLFSLCFKASNKLNICWHKIFPFFSIIALTYRGIGLSLCTYIYIFSTVMRTVVAHMTWKRHPPRSMISRWPLLSRSWEACTNEEALSISDVIMIWWRVKEAVPLTNCFGKYFSDSEDICAENMNMTYLFVAGFPLRGCYYRSVIIKIGSKRNSFVCEPVY